MKHAHCTFYTEWFWQVWKIWEGHRRICLIIIESNYMQKILHVDLVTWVTCKKFLSLSFFSICSSLIGISEFFILVYRLFLIKWTCHSCKMSNTQQSNELNNMASHQRNPKNMYIVCSKHAWRASMKVFKYSFFVSRWYFSG